MSYNAVCNTVTISALLLLSLPSMKRMHSSAVLGLLVLYFVMSRLVGVGESDERGQSALAWTTPQQVGFGSD